MTYYQGNHTELKQPPKLNEGGAAIQEKQPKEQTGSKGKMPPQENQDAPKKQ